MVDSKVGFSPARLASGLELFSNLSMPSKDDPDAIEGNGVETESPENTSKLSL